MTTIETTPLLGQRLAEMLHDYRGQQIFAPDAFFDINVPTWRFQVRGVERFAGWLQGCAPHGYTITVVRELATASGFVLEIEGDYEHHGVPLFFRNLYVCDVADGLITDVSFWCTGDWDPETRAQHAAEAPMLRS